MGKPDYVKIAVRIVSKAIKIIKKEVLRGSSDEEPLKEKCNGESVESSN